MGVWVDLDIRKYLSLLLFVSFASSQIDKNLEVETGWYDNGQKMFQRSYKNEKADGKWTNWWENGQKHGQGTYKDSNKNGDFTLWHYYEQKKGEGIFKDGKLISCKCWDINGSSFVVTSDEW